MAQANPIRPEQSSGLLSPGRVVSAPAPHGVVIPFPKARRVPLDPNVCYRDFPDLWMAWLRSRYRSPAEVARVFAVSEKTAMKWWNGIGGPRGDKLYFAVREIEGAAAFLFAAE